MKDEYTETKYKEEGLLSKICISKSRVHNFVIPAFRLKASKLEGPGTSRGVFKLTVKVANDRRSPDKHKSDDRIYCKTGYKADHLEDIVSTVELDLKGAVKDNPIIVGQQEGDHEIPF